MLLIRKDRLLVMSPHQLIRLLARTDEPLRASSINKRSLMAAGSKVLDLPICGDFFASRVRATVMVMYDPGNPPLAQSLELCVAETVPTARHQNYPSRCMHCSLFSRGEGDRIRFASVSTCNSPPCNMLNCTRPNRGLISQMSVCWRHGVRFGLTKIRNVAIKMGSCQL